VNETRDTPHDEPPTANDERPEVEEGRSREMSPLLEDSLEQLRNTGGSDPVDEETSTRAASAREPDSDASGTQSSSHREERRSTSESFDEHTRDRSKHSESSMPSSSESLDERTSDYSTLGAKSTSPDRPSVLGEESSVSELSRSDGTPAGKHLLVGLAGEIENRVFRIDEPRVLVGRGPRCGIQITQGEVSRTHCRLRTIDGVLVLETIDTVNDTLVDSKPLEAGESFELEDGDIVEISGVTAFEYRRSDDFDLEDIDDDTESRRGLMTGADTIGAHDRTLDRRIEKTLERTNGDLERAADMLGLEPENLDYLIDKFDVDRD
jgi:pSer/pThr/pTyr-binding forkhead associated (FHA) protein